MKTTEITNYFRSDLFEMSNFQPTTTGLSSGTKLWVREEPYGLSHNKYRIKISNPQKGSAVFAIWGDEPIQVAGDWEVQGKDLKELNTLVQSTYLDIRKHINGEIDSAELGYAFKNTIRPSK